MKDQCFARLEALIAEARRLRVSRFDEQEPEAATCHELILPLLDAFGFHKEHIKPEFRILGDAVDYLLKSERPLLFVEAKSLLDPAENLFSAHKEQVLRYIRNYRVSPEQTQMDRPVTWILLTNFAQFHFVRVNEDAPAFSFTLDQLWRRREELWELLARENVEAGHLEEVYDQRHKATLDQRFLADLKRWRLMFANGFKLRNQTRSLEEITLASQQLLNRFLFDRMLETHRLIEWNKLARAYQHYETFYGDFTEKTFAAYLRESLFSEIKFKFNTELFRQPLLCDTLPLDNGILSVLVGHEPLSSNIAATCGFGSGTGELLAFRHLYSYDFSLMSPDVMGAVYERFLAHKLSQSGGRIVIEDTDELRKKEGIYYTPKYIVDYIVAQTLGEKIKPILAEAKALLGYKNFKGALAKIRELSQIKVLDPAMGSGSFLLGAFDALLAAYADYNAACQRHQREHNGGGTLFDAPDEIATTVEHAAQLVLTENLHGVDLDAQALEVAKLNFWIRYMAVERDAMRERIRFEKGRTTALNLLPTLIANFKHGNSLIADANVAGDAAFDWAKEFPEIVGQASSLSPSGKAESETGATPVLRGGFDVVIGNPPYERIQTMQAHAPQAVEFLKANYRSAASGNFDIYVCFVECGLQLLKPDGVFGYICPHKFFQAEYGRELRTLLTEGRQVREILSFGDQQVFPQATTYTCLLFLQRQPQDNPVFIKVDDVEAWRQTGEAAIGKIAPVSFAGDQWNFVLGNGAELFAKLNQSPVRLRDVAERIAQGLRTSANPVYVLDLRSISGQTVTAFSEQLQREVRLERKAVALFLQGQDIRRYFLESCSKVVILPYQIKAGRAELISETHLRKKLPLTYEYLRENKKPLEGREDGRMRGEQWYAFVYPKNLELMAAAKILVPDIASFASFAFDETGEFAFASGYGITLKADAMESPAYLLGLLNSRLLDFYLKQVSTTMRGGYFRYFTQFIEQLPIRRIDPQKKAEAKLEREIVARVEQIQFAYRQRVKLPEVLTRLIAHDASRVPCSLAHYLQTEFAAAVQPEILIDDAQRTGFVHAVVIEAEGKALTLSATVTAKADAEPQPLPLLRLAFKDDALHRFIYARWKQFLAEHSRQKRWTKGKKPEAVYALLVNTLEPLVYFAPAAGDNLRAIHDVMKAVEQEAGSADLAALEAEIARLDREIDARVYELYGLTPEEIRIVEGGK